MSTEELPITFNNDGTEWSAMRAAESFIRKQGWAVGPTQRNDPRAVFFDGVHVSKWRNLTPAEQDEADAYLLQPGGSRHGSVTLTQSKPPTNTHGTVELSLPDRRSIAEAML